MKYMAEKYPIMVILTITIVLIGTSTYIIADTQLDQQQTQTGVKMRTDKDLYKCNEMVTVYISGKPNTTYLLVIKDPNGNMYTQINITTDTSGNATQTYTQSGPSGVWLLELYEITTAGKRLVAEWKYKVECDNQPHPVKMWTDKDLYHCEKDSKVVVFISGANPNIIYTLVVKKPDGTTATYQLQTDPSGNATVNIPLTQTDPSGVWYPALYDSNGKLVAEWKFNVECKEQPPPPTPPVEPWQPCLTVVSDLTTFVDRGNTVPVSFNWGGNIDKNLGIPGATPIWSSNGLDTNNPYTFTKYFILPYSNNYKGTLLINADDQWLDLKINGQFVASESTPNWGDVHTLDVSKYLQGGLNTLEVKAVDIGRAVAALAFKLDVQCKPGKHSTHWDKIIFTIDVKKVESTPIQPGSEELVKKLTPLIGKTLDIKVRDNPSEIVSLEDTVKNFLVAKFNLSQKDLNFIIVKIVGVEYAIDPNIDHKVDDKPISAQDKAEKREKKGDDVGLSNDGIYYVLPPLVGLAGLGAFMAMKYRRVGY